MSDSIQKGTYLSDNLLPFQFKVQPWLLACFGAEIAADRAERNHRFLEEALELVQACDCTVDEAHQLVDYVFGRPVGEKEQEVGGVMVTLAALCLAQNLNMHEAGETELACIWTKVAKIRAKQASKPKHGPLPEIPTSSMELGDLTPREGYLERRRQYWQQEAHKENARAEKAEKALTEWQSMYRDLRPGIEIATNRAQRAEANLAHADKFCSAAIDRERAALVRAERAEAVIKATYAALGNSSRFMDPPDGGDPTLAEQVATMRRMLEDAEANVRSLKVLNEELYNGGMRLMQRVEQADAKLDRVRFLIEPCRWLAMHHPDSVGFKTGAAAVVRTLLEEIPA